MDSFSGFDAAKEIAALEGRLGVKVNGALTNTLKLVCCIRI